MFLIVRNCQHGEQREGNTLHHVQPPILLMRQINKKSHFTDLTSHVRPMLRLQGSSLSWVSFDLSTKHVLWKMDQSLEMYPLSLRCKKAMCCLLSRWEDCREQIHFEKKLFNCACAHHWGQISASTPVLWLKALPVPFPGNSGVHSEAKFCYAQASLLGNADCTKPFLSIPGALLSPDARPPTQAHAQGNELLRLCMLLGEARTGMWGWDCPSGTARCCVFPFSRWTRLIYLARTNTDYPESFRKGRGRARVVPGHQVGGAFISTCPFSAVQRKPLHYQITTAWLWTAYQTPLKTFSSLLLPHATNVTWKYALYYDWAFSFLKNLNFLIHVHYLEGVTWINKFYVWSKKKPPWEECMETQE